MRCESEKGGGVGYGKNSKFTSGSAVSTEMSLLRCHWFTERGMKYSSFIILLVISFCR